MNNDITYKIRPAGRHLLTIGRDLIQDNYAAVVELVKNAYDADSPHVDVEFKKLPSLSEYSISIVISDHGHGMSRDDIINKWLVPSTEDKIKGVRALLVEYYKAVKVSGVMQLQFLVITYFWKQ